MSAYALAFENSPKLILCGFSPAYLQLRHAFAKDPRYSLDLCAEWAEALSLAEGSSACILIVSEELMSPNTLTEMKTRSAQTPGLHVLLSVRGASEQRLCSLLRHGCQGFLSDDCDAETVRKATECVLAGEIWADRKLVSIALRDISSVLNDAKFTPREREILERVAQGQDNRSIAEELFITRETVRWHLRSAYSKLGLHDRESISSRCMRATSGAA